MSNLLVCKKCDKPFKYQSMYNRHIDKKNSCYTELRCKKCHKIFKQKGDYNKHMNRKKSCDNIYTKYENILKDNEILRLKNKLYLNQLNDKDKQLIIKDKQIERLTNIISTSPLSITNTNSNNIIILNITGQESLGHIKVDNLNNILHKLFKQEKIKSLFEMTMNQRNNVMLNLFNKFQQLTYFNNLVPENHIILPDKEKQKFNTYVKQDKWEYKDVDNVLDLMLKCCDRYYKDKVKILRDDVGRIDDKYKNIENMMSMYKYLLLDDVQGGFNLLTNNIKIELKKMLV